MAIAGIESALIGVGILSLLRIMPYFVYMGFVLLGCVNVYGAYKLYRLSKGEDTQVVLLCGCISVVFAGGVLLLMNLYNLPTLLEYCSYVMTVGGLLAIIIGNRSKIFQDFMFRKF